MNRTEKVTLDNLGFGAAAEMFQAELEKVIFNIADPNTKPDVKRGITLKLSVKPSKDRSMCAVEIHCDSKLAAVQPFETTMFVGIEHGVAVASEYMSPQQQLPFGNSLPTPSTSQVEQAAPQETKLVAMAGGK